LAPGASLWSERRAGVLPELREFSASGAAAHWSPPPYEAAFAGREATVATQTSLDFSLASRLNKKDRWRLPPVFLFLLSLWGFAKSAFDESLLQHFFVAKPEVRNICRAEPKNVLERAADFV
jgi:hypothetical protein